MSPRVIKRLMGYIKRQPLALAGMLLCALAGVPLSLLVPVLAGRAIDCITGPGNVDFDLIFGILRVTLICVCASGALSWGGQALSRVISVNVSRDMRMEAFERVNRAPLAKLDSSRRGDMVSRLVGDTDGVTEGLTQALAVLFPGVVTILSTIAVMSVINIQMALIVVLVTPLSIVFARFVGTRTSDYFRAQTRAQGRISGHVSEMVGNLTVVQTLGAQEKSAEEFEALADEYYDACFNATFYSSVINPGTRFVNAIVFAAVGVVGILNAISGNISIGGVSAFLSYATQYTRPFNEVTAAISLIQTAIAGAERVFEIIDWEPEPSDSEDAGQPRASAGNVRIERLTFSYQKDRPLIRDLNLTARSGQRIALVGPTGCGKTTLINLLMRFYDPDSGAIYIDDAPSDALRRDNLRGLFGMVLQDTWLKRATVRENIAYARPDASPDEIEEAARTALAHSFIRRLPQGYDTVLDAGGGNLSEGQRQLLCIARIVLAKPDMLILDEATSSIDTRTEAAIQQAMENLMEGHTSFIVAHRLSTIQKADQILVMKDGMIIERGRHDELLAANGFYSRLYQSQFAVE